MTDQVYEVYVRTTEGETKYLPFHEGLDQFLSEEGYRLSINIEGVDLVLRRGLQVDDNIRWMDAQTGERSVDCMVTIKGHKGQSIEDSIEYDLKDCY